MKDGRPFTFAPALEKTGKIPNLESGSAPARLSRANLKKGTPQHFRSMERFCPS
jgi:hypothetical protein